MNIQMSISKTPLVTVAIVKLSVLYQHVGIYRSQ